MKEIIVHTAFNLIKAEATRHFAVGKHEVSDEDAQHWYVRAHSKPIDAAPLSSTVTRGKQAAPAAQTKPSSRPPQPPPAPNGEKKDDDKSDENK